MAHRINRKAFLSAKHSSHPLLSAYGQLVATELALKDHATEWPRGKRHDIPALLDDLCDPGLTALGAQLGLELAAILCTKTSGNSAPIQPSNYPELRYARHDSDYNGGTTNMHLLNLVKVIEDIIVQLRAKGVAI
jgi:hypothetical protein